MERDEVKVTRRFAFFISQHSACGGTDLRAYDGGGQFVCYAVLRWSMVCFFIMLMGFTTDTLARY